MSRSTNSYRSRPGGPPSDTDTDTDTDSSDSDSSSSSSSTSSYAPSPQSDQRRPKPANTLVHVISYSRNREETHGFPKITQRVLYKVDCCRLEPPPSRLCHKMFGTDKALAKSFWSFPANERAYRDAADDIHELLHRPDNRIVDKHVAVMVRCKAGMHRSVAMAERLARKISSWTGCRAVVEHYDLGFRVRERRGKLEREKMRLQQRVWELEAEIGVTRGDVMGGRMLGYGRHGFF